MKFWGPEGAVGVLRKATARIDGLKKGYGVTKIPQQASSDIRIGISADKVTVSRKLVTVPTISVENGRKES